MSETVKQKQLWRYACTLMWMRKREVLIGFALSLLGVAASLYQPWPLQVICDAILTDKMALPVWLRPWAGSKTAQLVVSCSVLLVVNLARAGLSAWGTWYLVRAGLRMTQDLRSRLYDHLQRLSLVFHERRPVGDSIYRVTWDTYSIQTIFNGGVAPFTIAGVTLGGMLAVMFCYDWLLTLLALVVAPGLGWAMKYYSDRIGRESVIFHERESKVSSVIQETLSSIGTVQAFAREDDEIKRFTGIASESAEANLRMTREQVMFGFVAGMITAAGMAAMIGIAGHRVLTGQLTVGRLFVFITYVGMLYGPMSTISNLSASIQSAIAPFNRVVEFLRANLVIRDLPKARPLVECRGVVRFEHVTFGYDEAKPVLKDVDFEARPGQTIALVGATGSGKSTLLSLLLRFYDPQQGRVLVDGADVREFQYRSLRQQIAVVPQEPVLFSSSIRENITYGRPDATIEQIVAAAKQAEAHEFISAMEKGYETTIGERGSTLSGGQRQRLALARAFLKDSPILILDEPTAALDTETEAAVLTALRRLREGRTVLIVAHRLVTVRDATEVFVMEGGRIAERGTHDQLLARQGHYARLVQLQFSDERKSS